MGIMGSCRYCGKDCRAVPKERAPRSAAKGVDFRAISTFTTEELDARTTSLARGVLEPFTRCEYDDLTLKRKRKEWTNWGALISYGRNVLADYYIYREGAEVFFRDAHEVFEGT
jgi:hypothetical protein